jgi:hypothetical protein
MHDFRMMEIDSFFDLYLSRKWNDLKRNRLLNKLLRAMDPREQYFVYSSLLLRKYRDFIVLLPEEVALKILAYLPIKDIIAASLVSKDWYKLCKSEKLWKMKYEKLGKSKIKEIKMIRSMYTTQCNANC